MLSVRGLASHVMGAAVTAGIVAVFVGYTIASYGVVLLLDYNVPWKRWINPLDPWTWEKGKVQPIPKTRILPK